MGVPPDPVTRPQASVELSHDGCLSLICDQRRGAFVLQHSVTKERYKFEPGVEVELGFHDGKGFVVSGGVSTWVNALLTMSVFRENSQGHSFVMVRRGEGRRTLWLYELQQRYMTQGLKFPGLGLDMSPCGTMLELQVHHFSHGREGSPFEYFWCLRHVQRCLDLSDLKSTTAKKWLTKGFSKTWVDMFNRLACAPAEILESAHQPAASDDVRAMHRAVSTKALVVFLTHCSENLQSRLGRESAAALMSSIIGHVLPREFAVSVLCPDPHREGESVNIQVAVRDHLLLVRDFLQSFVWRCVPARQQRSWPHKRDEAVSIVGIMSWLHARPRTCGVAWALFAFVLARLIELHLEQHMFTDPLQSSCGAEPGRLRDPAVRQQLSARCLQDGRGKSFVTVSKFAKSLGMDLRVYTADEHIELHRYWMSSLRHFFDAQCVCVVTDASRFGGQERLAACALRLDTGISAWCPPQAPPGVGRCMGLDRDLWNSSFAQISEGG